MRKTSRRCFVLVLCGLILLFACETPSEDGTLTNDAQVGTLPPNRIKGTFGLVDMNGTFELNFDQTPTSSTLRARAVHEVNGSLTFSDGTTYALTGTYQSLNGSVDVRTGLIVIGSSTITFRIMGLYVDLSGVTNFSGSIQLIHSNPVNNTLGSVAGVVSTPSSSVANYLGSFFGSQSGTWNMTIRDGVIVGTYSNSDPYAGSGTFRGTISGTTILFNEASNTAGLVKSFTGSGTLSGDNLSGDWAITITTDQGDESYSGAWSGAKVN